MPLERDVERAFTEEGVRLGAMVLKFTSPGMAGVPDRLVLFPDGSHCFVELKAPGKRPRLLQERIFEKLRRIGHPVYVIDSMSAVREYWRCYRDRCQVRVRFERDEQ